MAAMRAHLLLLALALLVSCALAEKGKYATFVDWCVENGLGFISPPKHILALVDPAEEETYKDLGFETADLKELKENGGRGIFAVNNAQPGDVILSVPFNSTMFMTDDYPPPPWKGADDYARLASLLLLEAQKGEESRFASFLRIIPSHVPLPWIELKPEEFSEFHYKPAVDSAQFFFEETDTWFKESDRSNPAFDSFGKWAWANAVLNTRAFWLPVPDTEGSEPINRGMFLPFGDMFNHNEKFHTEWEQQVFPDRVELLAVRPLEKGKQVYDHYGKRTTTAFFMEMGWIAYGNPHDQIIIFSNAEEIVDWYTDKLGVCNDKGDTCADDLVQMIMEAWDEDERVIAENEEEEEESDEMILKTDGSANPRLLVATEVLKDAVNKEHKERVAKDTREVAAVLEEEKDWRLADDVSHWIVVASRRLRDLLESYPTTAEEDEAMLVDDSKCQNDDEQRCGWDNAQPMTPARRKAVEFRLHMKKTITRGIERLEGQLIEGDMLVGEQ